MNDTVKQGWRPSRGDWVFIVIVLTVFAVLVLGSSDRTTKATPNDEVHAQATSRAACMACHGVDGVKPQPPRHTKADQCFQCHIQPEEWHKP